MKYFILVCFFVSLSAFGQVLSREAFADLNDKAKINFLDEYAFAISGDEITTQQRTEDRFVEVSRLALGLAEVWPDTILEGPYVQSSEERISESVIYLLNGQVYAYYFTVKAEGFGIFDESCEYDEDAQEWLPICHDFAGSIVESVYYDFQGRPFDDGTGVEFID